MKHITIYLIAISMAIVSIMVVLPSCSSVTAPRASKGQLITFADFPSEHITPRTIRVWLPDNYSTDSIYQVLYMHDGQMLYDANFAWNKQEWGIDEALDSLITLGMVPPTIVVGIDNTSERIGEYCPDDIAMYLPQGAPIYKDISPKGNDYLQFMVTELKPFIDSAFSVYTDQQHTLVMGSSCGGLISSYALCKYPNIFGGAACLSTHCTLAYPRPQSADSLVQNAYRLYLQTHLPEPNSKFLYMDSGDKTLDAYYQEAQTAINNTIRELGWDSIHFKYRFFPGDAHCEDDWRARLDIPLIMLLNSTNSY